MRWDRRSRTVQRALGLVAVTVALMAAAWPGPQRVRITNPGRFTGTNGPGSFYEFVDPAGTPIPQSYFDAGNPACDDGIDDDADLLVDAGQDPECDATDDDNERLDGVQEFVAANLPVTIRRNGRILVRPTELRVPSREKCFFAAPDDLWCLEISPRGTGPLQRGSIAVDGTMTVPIPMTIKFDVISGYPGFDSRCQIGAIPNVYVGHDYDEATGTVTLETGPVNPVPQLTNCGQWTDLLNAVLALPATGHSELVVTILNGDGDPPQIR